MDTEMPELGIPLYLLQIFFEVPKRFPRIPNCEIPDGFLICRVRCPSYPLPGSGPVIVQSGACRHRVDVVPYFGRYFRSTDGWKHTVPHRLMSGRFRRVAAPAYGKVHIA